MAYPIHRIFWFQFNLIILSLFFAIILFASNKNGLMILIFIALFCFHIHLSGLVYNRLFTYTQFFRNNIGSLIELMPLSVNGCILNSIISVLIHEKYKIYFYFFFFWILFILFKYDIFIDKLGFRYPNVPLNIVSSSILFLFFKSLPFENIPRNKFIIFFIKYITQFTGGIYYTHTIVIDIFIKYSFSFIKRNYSGSLIIYIICFSICFLGNKLFKNYRLKYLFL